MNPSVNGLEIMDLQTDVAFASRPLHSRSVANPLDGIHDFARALTESPETILQELVDAALILCSADSAGLSIERRNLNPPVFEWVATAGEYAKFLNAILPNAPSACAICLTRGVPQLFRLSQAFFDQIGVEAAEISDGMLMPWVVEGQRGTIWIVAHGRREAFDVEDSRIMRLLAALAAMGIRETSSAKLQV